MTQDDRNRATGANLRRVLAAHRELSEGAFGFVLEVPGPVAPQKPGLRVPARRAASSSVG